MRCLLLSMLISTSELVVAFHVATRCGGAHTRIQHHCYNLRMTSRPYMDLYDDQQEIPLPDDPRVRPITEHPLFVDGKTTKGRSSSVSQLLTVPGVESGTPGGERAGAPSRAEAGAATGTCIANVWFGTNRQTHVMTDKYGESVLCVTSERSKELTFGKTDVPLQQYFDKIQGNPPAGWFKKIIPWYFEDDSKTVKVNPLSWDDFAREVSQNGNEKDSLVVIHGFNVDFREAATRAAQLGLDLGIPGVTAFFSWPSMGGLSSYIADEATIEASEPYIVDFLIKLSQLVGDGKLHVIAHSMGNRGLLSALRSIWNRQDSLGISFGQIIFAAPDVDLDVFENIAKDLSGDYKKKLAKRLTLYSSNKDKAVKASGALHKAPRAGCWKPYTKATNVETVAADVSGDFLGHSYFAEAYPILVDINLLIKHNHDPSDRGIMQKIQGEESVWKLKEK